MWGWARLGQMCNLQDLTLEMARPTHIHSTPMHSTAASNALTWSTRLGWIKIVQKCKPIKARLSWMDICQIRFRAGRLDLVSQSIVQFEHNCYVPWPSCVLCCEMVSLTRTYIIIANEPKQYWTRYAITDGFAILAIREQKTSSDVHSPGPI